MQLFSFFKKEFVKNVLTLTTGAAFGQLITYASIVILTRLFIPEFFGLYVLFISVSLILKPLATLQYEFAIMLPNDKNDAANLASFSFLLLLAFCIILLFVFAFFKSFIVNIFDLHQLEDFIFLIPLSVFFSGLTSIIEFWNNRENQFKIIANGQIIKAGFLNSLQLATGFSKLNYLGLIPGYLLGLLAHNLYLLKSTLKNFLKFKNDISFKKGWLIAKKYKDIPIFNTLINFTNTLSNELPVLLITKFFGINAAGIFGLAIKFAKAPTGILQNSVNQVFFNKASSVYQQKKDLQSLILKTTKNLFFIAIVIFTILFILSFYVTFLFGENWQNVGLYIRLLIPWLFFAFICNPITSLILITNQQKSVLIADFVALVLRFFAFYMGYYAFDSVYIALFIFSIIGVFYNLFLYLFLLNTSKLDTYK